MAASVHIIDIMNISVYLFIANNISMRILHVIPQKSYTKHLCGNIGNDFPNAYTNEMVFVWRVEPNFGGQE